MKSFHNIFLVVFLVFAFTTNCKLKSNDSQHPNNVSTLQEENNKTATPAWATKNSTSLEGKDALQLHRDTFTLSSHGHKKIKPKLLFSSGFEGAHLSLPKDGYQYITGTDKVTGFTWPISVLGSNFSGIHRINDDNGKAIENRLVSVENTSNNRTTALFQKVNYDVQVTQTPLQINNIKENPKELYMKYRMKTDGTSVKGIDTWRAIWEYKTKNYASYKDGFRMIAFMATDYKGNPYWLFQGDIGPQQPVWQKENYELPLITNEWFKVEFYVRWSSTDTGYAFMKVNDTLVGEHHGPTTHNSDDLDFIMLTQVYGNAYPMYQWVDDIEIWDGIPQ